MELKDTEETRQLWNKAFTLTFTITLKATEVDLNVVVVNRGDEELDMTFCFHTYFTVSDLQKVEISNLKGLSYTDKTAEGMPTRIEENELVTIAGFTDRVYSNAPDQIDLRRGGDSSRKLMLTKSGFADW